MQTFLPYPSFIRSAKCLDYKRLGKQRVEAYQLILTLRKGPVDIDGKKTAWYNHPAAQMWKDFENALIEYGIAMCDEWIRRGYKDNLKERFIALYPWHQPAPKPEWFGLRKFHVSHKSNLLRKNKEYYSKYFTVEDNLPYYWPTKQ